MVLQQMIVSVLYEARRSFCKFLLSQLKYVGERSVKRKRLVKYKREPGKLSMQGTRPNIAKYHFFRFTN